MLSKPLTDSQFVREWEFMSSGNQDSMSYMTMRGVQRLLRIIQRQRTALTVCAEDKELKKVRCSGSHSQHSSMMNDNICAHCHFPEDGPGGDLTVSEPTYCARIAKDALDSLDKEPDNV